MVTVGRTWSLGSEYRYGFNGKESDSEISGDDNIYDLEFRIYNPRIGKFLSVDPLSKNYPWNTPYSFAENRVIDGIDVEGLEYVHYTVYLNQKGEVQAKFMADDFRNLTAEQIKLAHNMTPDEFYAKHSVSFGDEGPGISYSYITINENWEQQSVDYMFYDKSDGYLDYGIYSGSGCPTHWGPKFEHEKGVNDYDYSLFPIDEVDMIAMQHDKAYDFEGYGEGYEGANGILPGFITDVRTIEADRKLLSDIQDYLEYVTWDNYTDMYTGRKPSSEAIEQAKAMEINVKALIFIKEVRIAEYNANPVKDDE